MFIRLIIALFSFLWLNSLVHAQADTPNLHDWWEAEINNGQSCIINKVGEKGIFIFEDTGEDEFVSLFYYTVNESIHLNKTEDKEILTSLVYDGKNKVISQARYQADGTSASVSIGFYRHDIATVANIATIAKNAGAEDVENYKQMEFFIEDVHVDTLDLTGFTEAHAQLSSCVENLPQ